MLHRRLQILIDDARFQRLQDHARDQGVSVARVVRDLVDAGIPASSSVRRDALARIRSASPIDVPADPADLRRELDDARDRWDSA